MMRQRSTYQNRCRLTAFAFLLASCVRWCFASRRGYSDTHSGRQSLSPHQNSFPSKDLRIQLPYWRSTRPRVPKQHRPGFTKTPELCSILPANDVSSTRWKMACNRSINPIHLFAEFFLTALEGCRRPRPAVSSSFCSQHPALPSALLFCQPDSVFYYLLDRQSLGFSHPSWPLRTAGAFFRRHLPPGDCSAYSADRRPGVYHFVLNLEPFCALRSGAPAGIV